MDASLYYPVLRAKSGEFEALGHLAPRTKARVCPLLNVQTMRPDSKRSYESYFSSICQKLATGWGAFLPLYLDLPLFPPDLRVHEMLAVEFMFACSRQARLKSIPVTGTEVARGPGPDYLKSVGRIAAKDQRGAALRLQYADMSSSRALRKHIADSLATLALSPESIDLILDLEAIERIAAPGASIERIVSDTLKRAMTCADEWKFRRIIVAASNLPERVGKKFNGSAKVVPRAEVDYWYELAKDTGHKALFFGDYGIIYPHVGDAAAPVPPPARIRFATREEYRLHRAPRKDYRDLARTVVGDPSFRSSVSSWGQAAIVECATGGGEVGDPMKWVAWDTNRHIETNVAELERRFASLGHLSDLIFASHQRDPWFQQRINELLP